LRETLLGIARRSVEHGLLRGEPLNVDPAAFPPPLRQLRATFVTLRMDGQLRGCTGTLEALRPLVADTAHNAFTAAFRDPRFPPLRDEELASLELHISILSQPEPMHVASEPDLLAQLRPGVDGLILQEGSCRATFLPAVWDHVADPSEFVCELKAKAGLPRDHWSPELRCTRYTVESIS
jgi:AmmeMemoRadiSam system protein A